MAAALAGMSVAKLKLLDSALEKLADIAKNSAPLNDMFQSMKEGSMMMKPYNTFLRLIGAATTRASAETVNELFKTLSDPAVKDLIAELGEMFGALFKVFGMAVIEVSSWTTKIQNEINKQIAAQEGFWWKVGNITHDIGAIWNALWTDVRPWLEQGRREGMGEGFPTPPSGGTYEGGGGR